MAGAAQCLDFCQCCLAPVIPVGDAGDSREAYAGQNADGAPFFRAEKGQDAMDNFACGYAVCDAGSEFAHQELPRRKGEREPEPVDEQDTLTAAGHKKSPDKNARAELKFLKGHLPIVGVNLTQKMEK
jgi:hypothetical protein